MLAPPAGSPYEAFHKAELIHLLCQRDSALSHCQHDLMVAVGELKKVQRILNLRNNKLFGPSSEKSSRLGWNKKTIVKSKEIEDIDFEDVPGKPLKDQEASAGKKRYTKPHPGRYALPEGLRREVQHLYPDGYDASWKRQLPAEITERLSLRVELFVNVLVRHKYARELDEIIIAPFPCDDPFFRHKFTTELVANVMVMHFGMHMTYYQFYQQFLAPYGVSYTSVIDNIRKAHTLLAPLKECLHQELLKDARQVSMDETRFYLVDTPANVTAIKAKLDAEAVELGLESPIAKTKKSKPKKDAASMADKEDTDEDWPVDIAKGKVSIRGQMWALLNPEAKLILFAFSPTRATVNALKLLGDFQGILMADAYTVYRRIAKLTGIDIILLTCWAHARRRFLECYDRKHPDPVVKEVIARIARLYKTEKEIKGCSPRKRKKVRKRSVHQLRSLKQYLEGQLPRYAPSEAVAEAIQYCINHWEALSAYAHHQQAPIDNNATERAIRPITLARKTSLFLGSVEQADGAALAYSLMECCRLHGVDQFEYIKDILKKIDTYSKEQRADLLPHRWKKSRENNKPPS